MNWDLFETAINLYQGFLCIYFMRKVLLYSKSRLWIDALAALLIAALLSVHQFADVSFPDTVFFLIPFAHAILFSDEKWYVCGFWTLVLSIIVIGATELFGSLLSLIWSVDWEGLMEQTGMRLIYVVGANIFITIALIVAGSLRRHRSSSGGWVTVVFLIALAIELLINEGVYHLQITLPEGHDTCLWISACSLAAVIVITILYETMNALSGKRRQAELAAQTMEYSHTYQEELKLIYQKMLTEQHDLRHRLDLAEQMLISQDDGNRDRIKALIKEIPLTNPVASGNITVDAILAAKESAMRKAGIRFVYSGVPLHTLPISEVDFCVLLANLLDNAIEGVMRLPEDAPEREVCLSFSRAWRMFSIDCRNSMNPATIRKRGSLWISSKPNSAIHGFGTQSIRRIVEDADGFVEFKTEAEHFLVTIMIPEEDCAEVSQGT